MNQLKEFKDRGDNILKKYSEPLDNIIEVNDWVLGYCIEENFFNTQKILSISHKNKLPFNYNEPFIQIEELRDHFKYAGIFFRDFSNRGFTVLFVCDRW